MTTPVYAIAPSPKWYFLDAFSVPAAGGFLRTFMNLDHSTPFFVYSDPGGLFPYLDPIVLDATGGSPVPMYWDVTFPGQYYLIVTDVSGNIICTIDNFPISGSGGVSPITSNIDIENHIVNGAFLFIDANTSADSIINPIPTDVPPGISTRLAPASGFFSDGSGNYVPVIGGSQSGWNFLAEGGTGETSSIGFADVTLIGNNFPDAPSANATRYFTYRLSATGTSQTKRILYQTIPDVETFTNQTLTISADVYSDISSATGIIEVYQFYGTGGTPSAPTAITSNFSFTAGAWTRVSAIVTVPSIAPFNKGTNGDDCVQIRIKFPLNTIGLFGVTNVQTQIGNFASFPYIYQDYNQDQYKVLIDLMTIGNTIFPTGTIRFLSSQLPPPAGWILIDHHLDSVGSDVSGATFAGNAYKNLYIVWWTSFSQSECIVSGGRGADPISDFNANKMMTCPQHIVGTSIIAAGNNVFPPGFFQPFEAFQLGIGSTSLPDGGSFYLTLHVKL